MQTFTPLLPVIFFKEKNPLRDEHMGALGISLASFSIVKIKINEM